MHTRNGAEGRARLLGDVFAPDIFDGVFGQRLRRKSPLLRTVMHQPVFADVEITRTRPAAPIAWLAVRDILLEIVNAREMPFLEFLHFEKDFPLAVLQGPQLTVAIVDDPDSRRKP